MNTIVVYSSSSGFTERYAKWIGEALRCEVASWNDKITGSLNSYDRVIYGGNIFASKIVNYDKIKSLNLKNLVVFGVGFTEMGQGYEETLRSENQTGDTPLFYMQGGVDLSKANFFKKMILKKIASVKESIDKSNKAYIDDLVKYCNKE